jgi:hypothetical protein
MVSRSVCVAFVLSVSLAYGQLESNSITVTASRSAVVQPDQAVFGVSVSSNIGTSLDDVLAALAGSGITIANFSGVSSIPSIINVMNPYGGTSGQLYGLPTLVWNFTLPVSFSNMKATVAMSTALGTTITQNNSGLTLSFSVQGTQVSAQLQQMQTCPVSGLLSDARTAAQALANAANLFLGSILAMSSMTSSTPPCSLTVKFAVTR